MSTKILLQRIEGYLAGLDERGELSPTGKRLLGEVRTAAADEWNHDIDAMPAEGRFEALSAHAEVFRHLPNEVWVIIPQNGRMFVPYAWRPASLMPAQEQNQ